MPHHFTYLKNLKKDLLNGLSKTKVGLSPIETDKLVLKIARFSYVQAVKLQSIDKFTYFLIMSIPKWRKQFLNDISSYDYIFTA